jgi:hypothetical protein
MSDPGLANKIAQSRANQALNDYQIIIEKERFWIIYYL